MTETELQTQKQVAVITKDLAEIFSRIVILSIN